MLYLGADHGGFELKDKIKSYLSSKGLEYQDFGALYLDHDDDYPIFAAKVAQEVGKGEEENRGILICRSGGGMVIAANKFPKIRAVNCVNGVMAMHAREHNDANILVLSADFTSESLIYTIIDIFLKTPFSNHKRHIRRLKQIADFEKSEISSSA